MKRANDRFILIKHTFFRTYDIYIEWDDQPYLHIIWIYNFRLNLVKYHSATAKPSNNYSHYGSCSKIYDLVIPLIRQKDIHTIIEYRT